MRRMNQTLRNILVVRTDRLGDVITVGMVGLTQLAGTDDALDSRPNVGGNVGQHLRVEVGVGGQISIEELLARTGELTGAAKKITARWGKPDDWGRAQVAALTLLANAPHLE